MQAAAGTVTYAFVRGTYERSNSVLVAVHAPLCFALAVVVRPPLRVRVNTQRACQSSAHARDSGQRRAQLLGWVFAFDGLNIKSTLTTFNVSVILLNLC